MNTIPRESLSHRIRRSIRFSPRRALCVTIVLAIIKTLSSAPAGNFGSLLDGFSSAFDVVSGPKPSSEKTNPVHRPEPAPDSKPLPSIQITNHGPIIVHATWADSNSVALEEQRTEQRRLENAKALKDAESRKAHIALIEKATAALDKTQKEINDAQDTIHRLDGSLGFADRVDVKNAKEALPDLTRRRDSQRGNLALLIGQCPSVQ